MKRISFIFLISALMLTGCSVARFDTHNVVRPLDSYSFFIVNPTSMTTSSTGGVYGSDGYVYGSSTTKSVNPTDIISGFLMKRGYRQLNGLVDDKLDKTIIIYYGESGRHPQFLGYSTEVTIQVADAKTNELVATSTASGMGSTEADDIKKAVFKALDYIF